MGVLSDNEWHNLFFHYRVILDVTKGTSELLWCLNTPNDRLLSDIPSMFIWRVQTALASHPDLIFPLAAHSWISSRCGDFIVHGHETDNWWFPASLTQTLYEFDGYPFQSNFALGLYIVQSALSAMAEIRFTARHEALKSGNDAKIQIANLFDGWKTDPPQQCPAIGEETADIARISLSSARDVLPPLDPVDTVLLKGFIPDLEKELAFLIRDRPELYRNRVSDDESFENERLARHLKQWGLSWNTETQELLCNRSGTRRALSPRLLSMLRKILFASDDDERIYFRGDTDNARSSRTRKMANELREILKAFGLTLSDREYRLEQIRTSGK